MKIITAFPLAVTLLMANASLQPVYAATTAADQDKLRIHTSLPKKAGESLFSFTAEWRQDDGELYRSTGLSFLNAQKLDESTSAARLAKKMMTSMRDGMIQLDPNWRGLSISQPPEQAEMILSNKAGYSLTSVIVRDYTNQALSFDLVDKSFDVGAVQVAIDLVLAADVEYLDGFSSHKSKIAAQGDIQIRIGDQSPIQIKTDGKTIRELEGEIVRQLTASQLSQTSLVPSVIGKDTRNNKPFDGSEVQFLNLAAKSVAIDITDPSLGVLVKFKFKDENHSVKVMEPRFMLAILGLISLAAVGFYWRKNAKK